MVSVASQLIEEVTAHVQSDSLKDAREICREGTYFPNNLRKYHTSSSRPGEESSILFHLTIKHLLVMNTLILELTYYLPSVPVNTVVQISQLYFCILHLPADNFCTVWDIRA